MNTRKLALCCGALLLLTLFPPCRGQQLSVGNEEQGYPPKKESTEIRYQRLEDEIRDVMTALSETRLQLTESHQQIEVLRQELGTLRDQLSQNLPAANATESSQTVADLQQAVTQVQENEAILQSEVKQHEQTKVGSASKYPVTISGLILFTSFSNDGSVDDSNLPTIAVPSIPYSARGSFGGTMRQTVLGIDGKGPHIWGAKSSGNLRVDFFGNQSISGYASSAGTSRLRTSHLRLDWPDTSVIASVDTPLISPLQPTSYLTVAQPALAWSGNLWTWAPQIQVAHRFGGADRRAMELQFGLIDPATPRLLSSQLLGTPSANEASRQPGYETRFQYAVGSGERRFVVGAGGYYGRQRYVADQRVDAWAGTADWKLPVTERVELSGEFYRGRAIGGLGGGAFKDYIIHAASGRVKGFDAIGGWSQIKARLTSSIEANGAFGVDNGYADELRYSTLPPGAASVYSGLARNRTVLGNIIFRPRAYLVLSAEYRNIHSWQIVGPADRANSFGLAAGYLF